MVSPINYMLDVKNPIEEAIRGYTLGRADIEQRQQMQEREQVMGIRGQQEARAAQEFEARQAEAARQRAQAEAMQAQLMGLREMALEGTLTTEALDQFALANASTFDEFRTAFQNVSQPVREANVQFGLQLSTSLLRGNTEAALNMLDTRIAAAENTGTPQSLEEAQRLRAIRGEVEIDPVGFATANLANLTAQGAIDSTTMQTVLETAGQSSEATTTMQTLDQQLRAAGIVPRAEGGDGRYEQAAASAAGVSGGPTFRQATPEEAAVYGATAGQIDTATGRFYPIQSSPLVTNIIGEGQSEFEKQAGKTQASQYATLTETGFSASRNLRELDALESVLGGIQTGGGASVRSYLGRFGIATEGLDAIQAAEAAINRLVPAQRQPGSGVMSDDDLALFKRSLPSLINQPGGNQIIIDTIRAINEYDVAVSILAGQALDGDLTPAEARAAIRELPNPLAEFSAETTAPARAEGAAAGDDLKSTFMADPRVQSLSPEQQEAAWEIYRQQVGE
jgi:hypothetical protein